MSITAAAENAGQEEVLKLASEIVAAYVRNNSVPAGDLPNVIKNIHRSLRELLDANSGDISAALKPAVPVKKSVTTDYIVCLEDGKKLKMLKRYLRSKYDLSPDDYRRKWGLPPDYPMVAPNYSVKRSQFAKQIGLGRTKSRAAPKRQKRT